MIHTFSALHFRNLNLHAPVACAPHLNVLLGNNGQGKTNFLEGVHFLHHLSSFRTPRLERLLEFNQPECWLQAELTLNKALAHNPPEKVRVQLVKQGRKLWRGEDPIKRLSDWAVLHHVLVFHPAGLHQRKQSPAERRALLDRFLCSIDATYLEALRQFRKVHEQKNQLLKQGTQKTLPEWNHLFTRYGCVLVESRLRLVRQINQQLPLTHQQLMGEAWATKTTQRLQLCLNLSLQGEQHVWEETLAQAQRREIQAGHALYGPHRDDAQMYLTTPNQAAANHATIPKTSSKNQGVPEQLFSQGEHRMAFLALQFSLSTLFSKHFNIQNATMLLDDLFSELDPSASERVLQQLYQHPNQIFITTTPANQHMLPKTAHVLRVEQGVITPS